jgi:hypothetical protein
MKTLAPAQGTMLNTMDESMHPIFTARTHREEPHLYIGKVAQITGASHKAICV